MVKYFEKTFDYNNVQIKALEDFWELLMQEDKASQDKFFLEENTKTNLINAFNNEINIHSPPGAINLASASDIARVLLLYYYGGIYFDFDVYSKSDYILNISANSIGFKMFGQCDNDYSRMTRSNSNLLASIDHGEIITNLAIYISNSYDELYEKSKKPSYSDEIVSRFYIDLQKALHKDDAIEFLYVQKFARQQNIDIELITPLQKKKFSDVYYKSGAEPYSPITNVKRRMTIEFGPTAVQKSMIKTLSSQNKRLKIICDELIFPEKYVGPAISPQGSWSF